MKKWGRVFFNKFKEKFKKQKVLLYILKDKTVDQSMHQFIVERDRLNELVLHEKMYRKQRAKLFWLKYGGEKRDFSTLVPRREGKQII